MSFTLTSHVLSVVLARAFTSSLFIHLVFAICECGYLVNIDNTSLTFTEALETDFVHLPKISTNANWKGQEYNVTRETSDGPFGKMFTVQNIYTNPSFTSKLEDTPGEDGQSAGLDLVVKAAHVNGMVSTAEINMARGDIYWGSYRASMKMTGVPGTRPSSSRARIQSIKDHKDWS